LQPGRGCSGWSSPATPWANTVAVTRSLLVTVVFQSPETHREPLCWLPFFLETDRPPASKASNS